MAEERTFLIRIKARADEFGKGFKRAVGIGRAQLKRLKDQVFSLKGAFVALGGGLLAKSFISTASEFEKFGLQLETIEGSSEKAKASFDWIKTFAKDTPYELDEITAAFIKLKSYGIEPTDGTMRTLGDTAGAMGKSLDQAVEAFADAATGEYERLKEFGIKAQVEGDKVLFRYQKNGQEMVASADKNSQSMIQSTLSAIWNDRYAGGMEKQSKSWDGIWSNIKDTWTQIQSNIMEGGLFDYLKSISLVILDEMGGALKSSKDHAVTWANTLIEGIETVIKGAGFLGDAFRGFQIILKLIELSWNGLKVGALEYYALLEEGYYKILDLMGKSHPPVGPFQLWVRDARKDLDEVRSELDTLFTKEPASEGVERVLGRIRARFSQLTAAAKETKKTTKEVSSSVPAGALKQTTATDALIQSMEDELALMKLSEKERFIEQQMRKLSADATDEQRTQVRALAEEMYTLEDAGTDSMEELTNAVHGWGKAFNDTFADSVQNGKLEFNDLRDSIISDLLKIAAQKLITDSIVGAATGFFGSFHSGGVVGSGGGYRSVSPAIFAGATRYHTGGIAGLRPREYPAVLEYGEEVLTANDPRHVRNLGKGGSMPIDVRIHNEGSSEMEVSQAQPSFEGGKMILDVVINDMRKGGAMDSALQRQYGLSRKV